MDLLENGTIYCSPISTFANHSDGGRYDKDELVTRMVNMEGEIIEISPVDEPDKKLYIRLQTGYYREVINNPTGNLYCMFTLELEEAPVGHVFELEEKMGEEFGEYFVFIQNSKEFTKRVAQELNKRRIKFLDKRVKYSDFTKLSGDKDLFMKDELYAYQKEYRLFLNTGLNEAYKLKIGSIREIASIHRSDPSIRWIKMNSSNLVNTNMHKF